MKKRERLIDTTPSMPSEEDIRACNLAYQKRSRNDFMLFLRGLVIPSASGPQQFDSCITSFQLDTFKALAYALHAVRQGSSPRRRRYWIERTKKTAKDADLAVCVLWLMAFAEKPLLVQIMAADRDQAGIIKRRVEDLLYYNPWLNEYVDVIQNHIRGRNRLGDAVIEATDAASAHGPTPDLLILNELVHVKNWKVMETAMNNADGVPNGIVIISTNAGYKGTKAEEWRKLAQANPLRWSVHVWDKPSPWLRQDDLADAKMRNPPTEYDRLFGGKWPSGKGSALSEATIDDCFRHGIRQIESPEPGWLYLAGLDLGISHDHAALLVMGVHREQRRVKTAWLKAWRPDPQTHKVDLIDVENTCAMVNKRFRIAWFGYDPYQAELMAQRLVLRGAVMREVSFSSPTTRQAMATALIQLCHNRLLECFDDPEGRLRRDLGKFDIEFKTGSFRLVAESDREWGHADAGTSLLICLPKVVELLGLTPMFSGGDDVIAFEGDQYTAELSQDDYQTMPKELQEIYDMHGRPIR